MSEILAVTPLRKPSNRKGDRYRRCDSCSRSRAVQFRVEYPDGTVFRVCGRCLDQMTAIALPFGATDDAIGGGSG
jgi:hypothetical protein